MGYTHLDFRGVGPINDGARISVVDIEAVFTTKKYDFKKLALLP